MRKVASIVGILIVTLLISAVCPLPVQGWSGWPGIYDLHAHMTKDALLGARSDGLVLTDEEINRIAEYANEVDKTEGGPHHRVSNYSVVFHTYGGTEYLGAGAESWACDWISDARVLYVAGETSYAELCLGYAIHYIEDAVCPAHVFPFDEGIAHLDFEAYTWQKYAYRTWPSLVANATPIQISSAEDLRKKIMDAADGVNNLACGFTAPNGRTYSSVNGIYTDIGMPGAFLWTMTDDNIGLVMQKAAQLVKGAAIWATSPPTRIAYLHSSWGMQTMIDEISELTSREPGKYEFTWYDETNIDDLWSNLNNHNILLIDEDTFYPDWSWSQFGGPIYDSFKNHASTLKSWVENGGAIFTSGESDLYMVGEEEVPQGVWWDFLPEGMQVKSYDPELVYPVYILYDPGLYSYPNSLSDSYLSGGHPHSWFTAWDSGYAPTLKRTDNNLPIELYGVFGKGCIVVTEAEVEAGWAWEYLQNQLNFIVPSTSYTMNILSPQPGQTLYIGQQVIIKVAIKDNAGNPVSGAMVTATSPTGAPIPLTETVAAAATAGSSGGAAGILASPGTGIYEGTYTILPNDPIGDWVISIVASVGGEFPKQAIHTEVVPVITVSIDIKPGTYPNFINLGSKGVIPVAILTTADFDARTVDGASVRFGPSEAMATHYALKDVDRDGDIDMILQFNTLQTGIQVGDTEATLTGRTLGGDMYITGTDSMKVVPQK